MPRSFSSVCQLTYDGMADVAAELGSGSATSHSSENDERDEFVVAADEDARLISID